MLKEPDAERCLRSWLERHGYQVYKGVDVDCEAWRNGEVKWLLEVKGDQANDQAHRLSFFVGLGQVLVARSHSPRVKVSLAVTHSYEPLVRKYADVLLREHIAVYLIDTSAVIAVRLLQMRPSFRTARQGHPDGRFACGRAKYRVTDGLPTSYSLGRAKQSMPVSFARICRDLGIRVGRDSAARVLARRSTPWR